MKHAVILAHPRPRSFVRLLAQTYLESVRQRGHEAELVDLYALDFDPRLRAEEIPDPVEATPGLDVAAERRRLADVDVFCLAYPIWFGGPPAILKGYVERVFTSGFGYRSIKAGGQEPLLAGRRLISLTSSGSENAWFVESGGWEAIRASFDHRLAGATGLAVLDHINFGGVDADLDPALVDQAVRGVRDAVASLESAGWSAQ
jgi:NAD(P)H dehydrogenase (quinone)